MKYENAPIKKGFFFLFFTHSAIFNTSIIKTRINVIENQYRQRVVCSINNYGHNTIFNFLLFYFTSIQTHTHTKYNNTYIHTNKHVI